MCKSIYIYIYAIKKTIKTYIRLKEKSLKPILIHESSQHHPDTPTNELSLVFFGVKKKNAPCPAEHLFVDFEASLHTATEAHSATPLPQPRNHRVNPPPGIPTGSRHHGKQKNLHPSFCWLKCRVGQAKKNCRWGWIFPQFCYELGFTG